MTDKIKELNTRLKRLKADFERLEKSGLNREILIIYLHDKTKLPKKKIKQLLDNVSLFFDELIIEETVKEL